MLRWLSACVCNATNSLEECKGELDARGARDADRDENLVFLDEIQKDVHYEAPETQTTDEGEPVRIANQALLDEMNALSTELSAFTSLLVDCVECPDDSDVEAFATAIPEQGELQPSSEFLQAAAGDDSAVPGEPASDTAASVQALVVKSAPARAQSGHPLNNVLHNRPPPRNPHQSKLQRFLRTHPPKPNNSTRKRSKNNTKTRPKPQQQLHAHMREILGSPTLWKEYQSKSFQQHIRRQQQARLQVEQESLEAEKAEVAHFKRAKHALKFSDNHPATSTIPVTVRSTAVHDTTYLRRFCKDRRRAADPPHPAQQSPPDSPMMTKGLLCGVYLYGKRQLGLAYFTCSSLAQLQERVCQRFGVSSVLNFYRERVVATSTTNSELLLGRKRTAAAAKSFQRITSFSQVHDGDRLCATRDSYEDMAILCEWIKQRQQRIHHMQPTSEPPKPSPSGPIQHGECKSKTTQSRAQVTTTNTGALPAQTEENASLWDANGRCVAVKKQLIV